MTKRVLALIVAAPTLLSAQPAASTVTRAELAAAYLRLDHVVAAKTMDDSARTSLSRAFDRSTLSFFAGKFAAAISTIDSLTVSVSGKPIAPAVAAPPRLVKGKAPSVARDALLARLGKLDSSGALAQAIVSAKARASLLVDVPSLERGAEFLSDPAQLATALEREVSALERGRNPYATFAGDIWRSVRGAEAKLIPYRLVATSAVAKSSAPVPLLIALHGAGADENVFVDAYGAGITPKLAGERGMLFVSPATIAFSASPENLDALIAQLRSEYNIDTTRVYLIGHSLGAGAVARLASQRPNVIAAVVCLAGGAAVKVANAPPMLFLGAEVDPLIPAKSVEAFAAGTPTGTYRLVPHEGHTMMVPSGVRTGIPWLLEHTR
jgi:predicted esterase